MERKIGLGGTGGGVAGTYFERSIIKLDGH